MTDILIDTKTRDNIHPNASFSNPFLTASSETMSQYTPQDLKQILSSGLLSFPLTDFDEQGDFRPRPTSSAWNGWPLWRQRLFAAGGTGEFFSLVPGEYSDIIRTAVDTCRGKVPIIAGAGGSTRAAIAYAQEAERLGARHPADAHYLTEASQDGIAAHVEAVCKSVNFGVIIYNRAVCKLNAETLQRLADRCPNLIGFKDGIGEIEPMVHIRRKLGDRFTYLGGLPTAEVYAAAYKALGCRCSSAVFNFIPKTAVEFYQAIAKEDHDTVGKLIDDFFLLPGHPQPLAGCRLHRQGRRQDRRPRCRPGAYA
jgi:5-dehydro-4-deoxyglucarate dehydratase